MTQSELIAELMKALEDARALILQEEENRRITGLCERTIILAGGDILKRIDDLLSHAHAVQSDDGARPLTPPGYMILTNAEYRRLLIAAQCDDMLIWCEVCGAWLDRNDPAACTVDDFRGCWKAATGKSRFEKDCRSWRAPDKEPSIADCEPGADLAAPSPPSKQDGE